MVWHSGSGAESSCLWEVAVPSSGYAYLWLCLAVAVTISTTFSKIFTWLRFLDFHLLSSCSIACPSLSCFLFSIPRKYLSFNRCFWCNIYFSLKSILHIIETDKHLVTAGPELKTSHNQASPHIYFSIKEIYMYYCFKLSPRTLNLVNNWHIYDNILEIWRIWQ